VGAVLLLAWTPPASAQGIIGPPSGGGIGGGGIGGGIGGGGIGGGIGGGGLAGSTFGGGLAGTSMGGGLAGTSISGGALGFSGAGTSGGGALGFTGGGFAGAQGGGFAGITGGGFTGTTTTTRPITGYGGLTTGPQPSNPFVATYANPYALGYQGGNNRTAFGQAIVGTTATGGVTGMTPGLTGTTGQYGAAAPGGFVFASSYGVRRAPQYATTLGFDYRPPAPSKLQTDLQGVINRSSALNGVRENIRIVMVGRVAVLIGNVTTPRERQLAEALVRLEPGVAEVRNEIIVVRPSRRRLE